MEEVSPRANVSRWRRSPGWIRHKHVIPAISTPITLQSEQVATISLLPIASPRWQPAGNKETKKGNVSGIAYRENFAADVSIKRVGNVNQAPTVPWNNRWENGAQLRRWLRNIIYSNVQKSWPIYDGDLLIVTIIFLRNISIQNYLAIFRYFSYVNGKQMVKNEFLEKLTGELLLWRRRNKVGCQHRCFNFKF